MKIHALITNRKFLFILLSACLLALSFYIRVDALHSWSSRSETYFFGTPSRPIMLNVDGYYYMDLAEDWLNGEYDKHHALRAVPHEVDRPYPVPLLSVFLAAGKTLLPLSFEWIAAFTAPVLGILLAVPVFLLGCQFGGRWCGILAGFFSLIAPFYALRTSFARFDTDCLNVTFAVAAAYAFLRFALARRQKERIVALVAGFMLYGAYLWWWDQVPLVVTGIAFFPLVVAGVFYYRPPLKEGICVGLGGIALLSAVVLRVGVANFTVQRIKGKFDYIAGGKESGVFPDVASFVGEQQSSLLQGWHGHWGVLIGMAAVVGLVWLAFDKRSQIMFLGAVIGVAALSFFAVRFMIFWAPLAGLGIGYLTVRLSALNGDRPVGKSVLVCGVGGLALLCLAEITKGSPSEPWRVGWHYSAMQDLREMTEENAVVWASYGHGHPLRFYANRAIIADGAFHGGKVLYALNHALSVMDFKLAANWMHFYVRHGRKGFRNMRDVLDAESWSEVFRWMDRILAAGPDKAEKLVSNRFSSSEKVERVLEMCFPEQGRPLYLFIDLRHFMQHWYQMGAWDFESGDGPEFMCVPSVNFHRAPSGQLKGEYPAGNGPSAVVNDKRGTFDTGNSSGKLTDMFIRFEKETEEKHFERERGFRFEMVPKYKFGVLVDQRIARTVFNRLFTRVAYNAAYFEPVQLAPPRFQVWEVKGDSYKGN